MGRARLVAELPDAVRTAMFAQPGAAPLKVVHVLFGTKFATLRRAEFEHVG